MRGVLVVLAVTVLCSASPSRAEGVAAPAALVALSGELAGAPAEPHKVVGAQPAAVTAAAAVAPRAEPTPAAAAMPAPAPGAGVSAAEPQQRAIAGPWRGQLNFAALQKTLAHRLYPGAEVSLFGVAPPPEVVTSGFGLLVERRFGL